MHQSFSAQLFLYHCISNVARFQILVTICSVLKHVQHQFMFVKSFDAHVGLPNLEQALSHCDNHVILPF